MLNYNEINYRGIHMFKKLASSLLILSILVGQFHSFAQGVSTQESLISPVTYEDELAQKSKEEIIGQVKQEFHKNLLNFYNVDEIERIKMLNTLLREALPHLDTEQAIDILDEYSQNILVYIDFGNLTSEDIQWTTEEFVKITGEKISGLEGVHKVKMVHILKRVIDANTFFQGKVSVPLNQVLTIKDLETSLSTIEETYRRTSSLLFDYNYKDLSNNLSKKLVMYPLSGVSGDVDMTLSGALIKKLVGEEIALLICEDDFMYEIPVTFLSNHDGEFKIDIKTLPIEAVDAYGYSLASNRIEPVIVCDIKIGHITNKEMINVYIKKQFIINKYGHDAFQTLIYSEGKEWGKLVSLNRGEYFLSPINSTTIVGLAQFYTQHANSTDYWLKKDISELLARGILDENDFDIYDLNGPIGRDEFIGMLVNIVGSDEKGSSAFNDLIQVTPYVNQVNTHPELTHQEMLMLIAKISELEYINIREDQGNNFDAQKIVTKAEAFSVICEMLKNK